MIGLIDGLIAKNATLACILDSFYKFNATHKLHPLSSEGCNMQAVQVEVNYDKVLRTPNTRLAHRLLSAVGNQEIDAARARADRLGIQAVPTIPIDDRVISGAQPPVVFASALRSAGQRSAA
ncbi:hypothetical protein [Paraburkholderia sp. BL23I1N1]|uniref:hypothetical protein n=1 Tax=Paraburkholderia sp. BL23I1N1 TaxID=1938802 RepID=UPI00217DEB8D|nr:hypothetical protein [Paraburkholderia sp. BL23I1N1]